MLSPSIWPAPASTSVAASPPIRSASASAAITAPPTSATAPTLLLSRHAFLADWSRLWPRLCA